MSSLLADRDRVLRAGTRTEIERETGSAADEYLIDYLVGGKLAKAQRITCPVTTLSRTIETDGTERIALVKVDVECAEHLVLGESVTSTGR